jgi:hypothetical protein
LTAHRRTEITVETDRVLMIRRRRVVRAWCRECGGEVEMVSLEEAEALTEVSGQVFQDSAQAHRRHFYEDQEGTSLVCLESVRKSL